jgi:hypothetical protein
LDRWSWSSRSTVVVSDRVTHEWLIPLVVGLVSVLAAMAVDTTSAWVIAGLAIAVVAGLVVVLDGPQSDCGRVECAERHNPWHRHDGHS